MGSGLLIDYGVGMHGSVLPGGIVIGGGSVIGVHAVVSVVPPVDVSGVVVSVVSPVDVSGVVSPEPGSSVVVVVGVE
ncbi:MAG: hypothetical protein ACXVQ5_00180, partial [Actinomycetota bacterium]